MCTDSTAFKLTGFPIIEKKIIPADYCGEPMAQFPLHFSGLIRDHWLRQTWPQRNREHSKLFAWKETNSWTKIHTP
jgi:hypothetical protein